MRPEIYIDGKPFDGIGELKFELGEEDARKYTSAEMVGPFYATGGVLPGTVKFDGMTDSPELVIPMNIGPGEIMQIITEGTKKAIEAFNTLVKAAKEAEKQLVVWGTLEHTPEELAEELRSINPRWYHMSNHAGKARTRKKYRNRLMRERARRKKAAGV